MSQPNNKVIIELYGVPGVGKSTLAKKFAQEYNFSLLVPVSVSRAEYLFIFFRYLPAVLCWSVLIIKNFVKTKKVKLFRYNISLLFLAFKKIHLAHKSTDRLIVIDEGLVQRLLSYSDIIISEQEIARLLRVSPLSTAVILVNDREVVKDRYDSAHDRGSVGTAILNNWRKNLAQNLVTVKKVLMEKEFAEHFETVKQPLVSIVESFSETKCRNI